MIKKIIKKCLLMLLIIFMLIPVKVQFKDGGTKTYTAILYKVIIWHHAMPLEDDYLTGVEVHVFPFNLRSIDYYIKKHIPTHLQ